MNQEIYLIGVIIIVAVAVGFYLLNKKLQEIKEATRPDETLKEWLKSQQETSQQTSKAINERLDNAARVIGAVQKNIGEMSEIGRGMKELQEFLKSPKLRGNIGEEVLQDLIGQMFPKNSFLLQYAFKSGHKVDAAIKMEAGILPIDSKFPMESFQRLAKSEEAEREKCRKEFGKDVKAHIETIAKKYILPEEGTMDFALMYVPSEGVYYELVQMVDLMDYARKVRVYPVSPSTLYAHLQTILLSFEGKKLESKSKEVFKLLRAIQGDYEKIDGNLGILGSHIKNTYNQMDRVVSSFSLLGQKLESTRNLDMTEEVLPKIEA